VSNVGKIDFGFNPVSKASQTTKTRIKQKAKQRGEFSQKTIDAILARDEHKCVKCGSGDLDIKPHHITYRSQGGAGSKWNGATICKRCHEWVHNGQKGSNGEPSREGRYWFEAWRDTKLDDNGDYLKED
jgi:5-methylcytosine-specific restriction endonuclease McrA